MKTIGRVSKFRKVLRTSSMDVPDEGGGGGAGVVAMVENRDVTSVVRLLCGLLFKSLFLPRGFLPESFVVPDDTVSFDVFFRWHDFRFTMFVLVYLLQYSVCKSFYSTVFVSLSTELVHNKIAIKQYITHNRSKFDVSWSFNTLDKKIRSHTR